MKHDSPANSDKTSIQVIERMIALLDALASYPDPVSLNHRLPIERKAEA